jgi:cytochrome P450
MNSSQKPPSPKGNFILGHAMSFRRNPLEFMIESVKALGDFISFRLLTKRVYLVSDAEIGRYILQSNNKNYTKSPGYRPLRLLVGNGLFTSEGTYWLRQRRIYQPAFSNKSVANYTKNVTDSAQKTIAKWQELTARNEPINASQDMTEITLEIIGRSLFSTNLGEEAKHFFEPLTTGLKYINDRAMRAPFVYPTWFPNEAKKEFDNAVNNLDQVVSSVIQERQQKQNWPEDLLTSFLTTKDEESGENLTPSQVRDECMTLFLAGHESTANVLNWLFFLLTKHPEVRQKVLNEIDQTIEGRIPGYNDLHKLTYLVQVINETMRLYPPIWHFGRMNINEDEVGGYTFKPKSHFRISCYTIHRNPKYWKDPDRFDPERFSPVNIKNHVPGSFIPFGYGPRLCVGRNFAMMEITLIIAMLYQKYIIKVKDANQIKILALLMLRPDRDMVLELEER